MDPIQLAAALSAVVLVASVVSVEAGVTVALLELTLGVVVGNVFGLHSQDWLDFVASFASIVLTFLAGMEVDPGYMRRRLEASVGIGVASFAGPFLVASLVAWLLLGWTNAGLADRGDGALHDLARRRLRRARRARADRHRGREAPDERDLRHRPLHRPRALGDLRQAEPLVPALPRRLGRARARAAEDRARLLPPLRQPGDRARDQARLRLSAPADGAGRRGQRPRRPARVRARARDEPPLRGAPRGAEAAPGRRLRVPDAVLLPQGRPEHLARLGGREPRGAGRAPRRQ